MGRASKAKGSSWERDVCRRLSLWVTGGELEDVFWRSSMSGGRATTHRKRGKRTADAAAGDICAIRPEGKPFLDVFFVECKATRNLMLEAYLTDTITGNREDHWLKPCRQAAEHGKAPLVILKRNRLPPVVFARPDSFFGMGQDGITPRRIGHFPKHSLCVYDLTDLLLSLDPAEVHR